MCHLHLLLASHIRIQDMVKWPHGCIQLGAGAVEVAEDSESEGRKP